METQQSRTRQLRILCAAITPIVRFCLARGLFIHEFEAAAKRVFLKVATEEMSKSTAKINASRLSIATGIYRSEVVRLLEEEEEAPEDLKQNSIFAKVVAKWETDPQFKTRNGYPKELAVTGERDSFQALVASITKHINHASVLFELQRNGAVKNVEGRLTLVRGTEKVGEDEEAAFSVLTNDYQSLMNAVEHNVRQQVIPSQMHYRTSFDNIPPSELTTIKSWLVKQGQIFHRRMRAYLAQFDRDSSSSSVPQEEGRATVSVTSFSFASELDIGAHRE